MNIVHILRPYAALCRALRGLLTAQPDQGESEMKKLLVTLIAATFVSAAVAQGATDPPMTNKQKQEALRSSTISGSDRRPAVEKQQEANVKASKATEKMTTDEKNKALKDVNTKMVNPNNAGGVEATAKMR
jgi:Ni/Co efflux regulator RcnB